MKKLNRLKNQVKRNLILAAAAIAAGAGITSFAWMQQEDMLSRQGILKSEINTLEGNYKSTKDKLDKAKESIEKYKQLRPDRLPDRNMNLDITAAVREAREVLGEMKKEYKIADLDMSISPPVEVNSGKYKNDSLSIVSAKVTLKYGAPSDQVAYSFVKALIDKFPGYVRMESINMDKIGEINDQAIMQARSKGVVPSLVTGIIVFEWIKFKEIPKTQERVLPMESKN